MRLKAEQLEKYLLLTRLLHGRYGLQIALNRLLGVRAKYNLQNNTKTVNVEKGKENRGLPTCNSLTPPDYGGAHQGATSEA